MLKAKGEFFGLCALSLMSICLFACNNGSNSVFGSNKLDSLVEEIHEKMAPRPVLHDKWDSLKRNQIVFKVDTLHPVDIKTQKQKLKDSLRREFDKKPKHVYLTFDDGPLVGSKAIDSLAKAKNIKVNVFVVGRHADMGKGRMNDLKRYIDNPLVAVYNHSYTHGYNRIQAFYSDSQKAFDDFKKNEATIALKSKIARLPGRNIWMYEDKKKVDLKNALATAEKLFADSYKIYGWDVEWRLKSPTGEPFVPMNTVYSRMVNLMDNKMSQEPNNVVFLMHDDMFQTKKGQKFLSDFIDSLIAKDYKFEFMDDYPIKY